MTTVNVNMIEPAQIYSICQFSSGMDVWLNCLIENGITTFIDIRLHPAAPRESI